MESKAGKERGILKLEPRARVTIDTSPRIQLTPQGSWEREPASPQPSVDRLSVTWAAPGGSMTSSGVNLFHLPSETAISNEVKFSTGDGSDDEDYSASLSAVLRQRRTSVRKSRKSCTRRPSSPFLPDDTRSRRRSSVFTTSSGDTAISIEEGEPVAITQEQIFENIHLHKEVLGSVKQQPLGMRRKLKIVHQAKVYIKNHEGRLQERLAQSKSTRDIYARFNILLATKWQQMKREAANMSNLLIPWELRIKEIESHFGSVVASYFTFLRWLFWVNLVIAFVLMMFVIIPEYLTANPNEDGERKKILEEETRNASNLLTLWEFDGVLKCSPIFYGYYTNVDRPEYRMPLAYFLTGLVVYIYSFVATLRKMAENSRMSKLSEKEDECVFSWKLFTGWDFMIGNAETAYNRIASVILGFKEALLEEAEKKKDLRNWRVISLRALVNVGVVILLAVSAYAVVTVVSRSDDNPKVWSWWQKNETTIVVTGISITFPIFFELLGFLEHYHPRKQLRWQLARIMLLNLLNLYSLIFALFSKIEGMSKELSSLKPSLNASSINNSDLLATYFPLTCSEELVSCEFNDTYVTYTINTDEWIKQNTVSIPLNAVTISDYETPVVVLPSKFYSDFIAAENLVEKPKMIATPTSNYADLSIIKQQLEKIRLLALNTNFSNIFNETGNYTDTDYAFDVLDYESTENPQEIDSTFGDNNTINSRSDNDSFSTSTSAGYDSINTSDIFYTSNWNENYTEEITENSMNASFFTAFTDASYTTISDLFQYNDSFKVTNTLMTKTDVSTTFDINNNVTSENENSYNDFTTKGFTTSTEEERDPSKSFVPIIYKVNSFYCPYISFNFTVNRNGMNITEVISIKNCSLITKKCYVQKCEFSNVTAENILRNKSEKIFVDTAYIDSHNRTMYNLTQSTKKKLWKLCWETMFGQELVKLTMMDLVFFLLGTLFLDFFRALLVRYLNKCWCWDLEKKFPEYGDFKIAENILHLINNQGMVWMGMFFSPGLVVINVFKLIVMMYLRSWAVMTCNVPHEVVFRVSKSNNFYLALLLTMLFLCVLPVGYSIVWVKPSWHCGPFSENETIYHILTSNIYKVLPKSLNFTLECIASPAIVIPILVLLILIIYYLTSLTNSLREANNDLKIQLRRERTEERRKMFQLADTRRRGGSSAMDNTPFARWKKALPSLPLSKSIDSDEVKAPGNEALVTGKITKKKGGIFAKIVSMALDKKTDVEVVPEIENDNSLSPNNDDETDTVFHEVLPKEVLKMKDIILKIKRKNSNKMNNETVEKSKLNLPVDDDSEKAAILEKQKQDSENHDRLAHAEAKNDEHKKIERKQTSESSTQSRQSDLVGAIIPVITISTTETDDESQPKEPKDKLKEKQKKIESDHIKKKFVEPRPSMSVRSGNPESKSLKRQTSVDSTKDFKYTGDKKTDEGHKYQYSL